MAAKRSRSWWRRAVRRWERSGLGAEEFARREDLKASTLRWWRSELRREGSESTSTPVPLAVHVVEQDGNAANGADGAITIEVGELVVRLAPSTDVDYVAALVQRLGR